ncbi:MAG: chemotaxis protein CheA [Oscillospiraceae bacterium]|jgi:two-component system chemotaxis sensor kinase CheA|nr:chemotaxis protein CheA [Oscillospiraceae bacterium]
MSKVESGMESMIDMYIFETNTLLEQLDEILLKTEQAQTFTDDDINEIFRIMHTVKGSSAMMGFDELQLLAHKGEELFFIIREKPGQLEDVSFIYDLVFRMSDLFKAEVELIQSEDEYEATDFSDTIKDLDKGAAMLTDGAHSPIDSGIGTYASVEQEKAADCSGEGVMTVRIFFQEGCKMENLRSFMLLNKIREEADVRSFHPADLEGDPNASDVIVEEGFTVTFKSEHDDNESILKLIENAINVESYEVINSGKGSAETVEEAPEQAQGEAAPVPAPVIENVPAVPERIAVQANPESTPPVPATPTANTNQAAQLNAGKQSIISVNLAKLDQLHDIVGEIITTESMVISNPELEGLKLESFLKSARELKKLTDELQDTVMSIRMVPLAGPFQKMNRIVRDMKMKLGKDAELKIEGENTEVDKTIVDSLNDPLMHLVRNCMDHGIENSIEERLERGKPAKATITLNAVSSSGEVVITISDDGKGIDCEKVLRKAEMNGLLMKPANEYTEREIQQMILMPGFSTNDVVTEFSGRGVGMDVVRDNIEKCGGTLTVESKQGFGTTFMIKIPLTLAIIQGMEVKVDDTVFAIPISTIRQSFKVQNSEIIKDTQRGEMIMIRGECYPIMRLHEKFAIPSEITDFEDGILLLVETDGKSVCLFADRLIGEQQVVVKPFPPYLGRYNIKGAGLSGCTIMGDGSISLIIDVANLIEAY